MRLLHSNIGDDENLDEPDDEDDVPDGPEDEAWDSQVSPVTTTQWEPTDSTTIAPLMSSHHLCYFDF